MTQNELSAVAVAVFIGFALLRGLFRMLRRLGGGGSGGQMERIEQAAQRVLKEKRSGRSSVPLTQAQSQAKSQSKSQSSAQAEGSRASSQRQNSQNQPRQGVTKSARGLTAKSTPAVIRRGGLLSGTREPVIQRRR